MRSKVRACSMQGFAEAIPIEPEFEANGMKCTWPLLIHALLVAEFRPVPLWQKRR